MTDERALGQLGQLDRDLILLVTWDELTPSRAGAVLGLGPSIARSRVSYRARQRLAALREAAPPVGHEEAGCRLSGGAA